MGVASLSSLAHADDCPAPTDEQCYDDAYYATECGVAEFARMQFDTNAPCSLVIAARSEAERAATATVDGFVSVPSTMSAETSVEGCELSVVDSRDLMCNATVVPYQPSIDPVSVLGAGTSFASASQRFRSESIGGWLQELMLSPILARQAWEANGDTVETCEEYVYERYYDYSKWEDTAAALGSDYRAIFEDARTRFAQNVRSKDRQWGTPLRLPERRAPKNVFFAYRQDYPAAAGMRTYRPNKYQFWDPDLVARLDRGKGVYERSTVWHERMNTSLAAHGDAKLYALAQKQREFIRLLEKRAAVFQRWKQYDRAMRLADGRCDDVFTPYNIPALSRLVNIWDPADHVPGFDLLRMYDRSAFEGQAISVPPSMDSMIATQNDVGLIQHGTLEHVMKVADVQNMLVASVGDVSAIAQQSQLMAATPEQVADIDVEAPPGNDIPLDVPGPKQCVGYTGEDGLPTVGNSLSCQGFVMLAACADGARYQVTQKLREIDAEIERALQEVAPYGCLELAAGVDGSKPINPLLGAVDGTVPSACDWNPELFYRDAADRFVAEREAEFTTCKDTTGGIFYAGHPIHMATTSLGDPGDEIASPARAAMAETEVKADYTGSTTDVAAFIAMAREWARALEFQRDHRGRPIPGHSSGDSDRLGNSMFGVAYDYGAEWKLTELPTSAEAWSERGGCDVDFYAQASANAHGTVFGTTFELLEARAKLASNSAGDTARSVERELTFEILGTDILAGDAGNSSAGIAQGSPLEFHVARELSESFGELSQTIVVAGIPVTVRAGAAGRVGLQFDATVTLNSGCPAIRASMSGTLTPWASLDAFVSGGVDLAIAEVGLQIDLTLLRLAMPFELAMDLAPYEPGVMPELDTKGYAPSIPMIHARPRLSLQLSTLAGQFRAYVRFPIGTPWYVTLFSWDGVELGNTVLFAPVWKYSLARVALGLQLAGQGY